MRTIAIGLSPNAQKDDVLLAISMLLQPRQYKNGTAIRELEQWFCEYFHVSQAISFSNARSGLFTILHTLGISFGDEVILQSFTCVVVPNAVVAVGGVPIYVDVTDRFVLDPDEIEKKITQKTKAIIVQHTFGIPAAMEKLQAIAKKHKIFLIEDVAHTIGALYKGQKLGTFSDAAFFSFGRDKAFSSIFGGMVITSHKILGRKIRDYQQRRDFPSNAWVAQQLFHPIAFSLILPLYDKVNIGKLFLRTLQKLGMLSFPVSLQEKNGVFTESTIYQMPNALAKLALHQLKKILRYNLRRIEIASQYEKILLNRGIKAFLVNKTPLLRYPLFVEDIKFAKRFFRKEGVYVGDWYSHIIDPKQTKLESIHYSKGCCPHAEELAKSIINLPVYPTMSDEDVQRMLAALKNYVGH